MVTAINQQIIEAIDWDYLLKRRDMYFRVKIEVARKELSLQSFFSICIIRKLLDDREIYWPFLPWRRRVNSYLKKLEKLHCISYDDMPQEVLRELPGIVAYVVSDGHTRYRPQHDTTVIDGGIKYISIER